MKKSVAMKWIKALRSGKYTQTSDRLKGDNGSYCCLGVLCDISKLGRWMPIIIGGSKSAYMSSDKETSYGNLPSSVQDWAGISSAYGRIEFTKNKSVSLTELNDARKRSFKQIAAYIERNWRKL